MCSAGTRPYSEAIASPSAIAGHLPLQQYHFPGLGFGVAVRQQLFPAARYLALECPTPQFSGLIGRLRLATICWNSLPSSRLPFLLAAQAVRYSLQQLEAALSGWRESVLAQLCRGEVGQGSLMLVVSMWWFGRSSVPVGQSCQRATFFCFVFADPSEDLQSALEAWGSTVFVAPFMASV